MTMRLAYENSAAYAMPRTTGASAQRGAMQPARAANARGSLIDLVLRWRRRARERRAMLRLDDHLLRDIGIDRMRVEQLAARPFWRD